MPPEVMVIASSPSVPSTTTFAIDLASAVSMPVKLSPSSVTAPELSVIGSRQISILSRRLMGLARQDQAARRLMTAPGVGSLVALAYISVIDTPDRFSNSSSVGAYLGLTPRRYQSGEIDRSGRISKCGDPLLRTYLFEAAGILLNRVSRWSALKAWGTRLAKKVGGKKATVAVARKLAVILHRMWRDNTDFRWSRQEGQPA